MRNSWQVGESYLGKENRAHFFVDMNFSLLHVVIFESMFFSTSKKVIFWSNE
jgi:hypothetical protein